jgi:hypothetical protein
MTADGIAGRLEARSATKPAPLVPGVLNTTPNR